MTRIYCHLPTVVGDRIIIKNCETLHYLNDVLRLKVKDRVVIFDGMNKEYDAIIDNLSGTEITFAIKKTKLIKDTQAAKITVACAIPKKSKIEEIIDKLTQLGVERIIPLITERVIVKLDNTKKTLRLKRWNKIALNAAQQSQRSTLPIIDTVKGLSEVLLESDNFELKLIPTLSGERKPINKILSGSGPKNILVLIGPEGDFTSSEVNLAKAKGFTPVSLGNTVLRVETAAVAVVSYLRFLFL